MNNTLRSGYLITVGLLASSLSTHARPVVHKHSPSLPILSIGDQKYHIEHENGSKATHGQVVKALHQAHLSLVPVPVLDKEALQKKKERIKEYAQEIKEEAKNRLQTIEHKMGNAYHSLKNRLKDLKDRVKNFFSSKKRKVIVYSDDTEAMDAPHS